jgi:hypothetical protein
MKRKTGMTLALVTLLATTAAAQAQPEADLTLPFTLEAGLPVLQARIDGRDARLLIDSGGAAALALRPDWAPALEAKAEAPGTVSTQDAQGQVRRATRLIVTDVVLAGQALPEAPAAQTWTKAKRPADTDGYLGWGWLRERRWVVDYAARSLVRLAPASPWPAGCGGAPLPLEMIGSLAVVRLQALDGQTLVLGLDTGASRNVVRPDRVDAVAGPLRGADGQTLQAGRFVSVPLQVPGLDGFLGQDFFSRHRVCVDPAGRQLRVQPLAG